MAYIDEPSAFQLCQWVHVAPLDSHGTSCVVTLGRAVAVVGAEGAAFNSKALRRIPGSPTLHCPWAVVLWAGTSALR